MALLAAFATVVLLFSKFLFWAQKQEGEISGALHTSEREFQSVFENALDAILILDDNGICREANPAAEQLFGTPRPRLIGFPIERFYENSHQFQGGWQTFLNQKFQQSDAELLKDDHSPVFVEYTAKADCLPGAAKALDVEVGAVQKMISDGQLKLVDTFVTDRAFEEFCRKNGSLINMALIDLSTRKWLVSEYGVPDQVEVKKLPRAQKHALIIRACKCGRKIAGNVYFRHVRHCPLGEARVANG